MKSSEKDIDSCLDWLDKLNAIQFMDKRDRAKMYIKAIRKHLIQLKNLNAYYSKKLSSEKLDRLTKFLQERY